MADKAQIAEVKMTHICAHKNEVTGVGCNAKVHPEKRLCDFHQAYEDEQMRLMDKMHDDFVEYNLRTFGREYI